jgi:hypothetical protein
MGIVSRLIERAAPAGFNATALAADVSAYSSVRSAYAMGQSAVASAFDYAAQQYAQRWSAASSVSSAEPHVIPADTCDPQQLVYPRPPLPSPTGSSSTAPSRSGSPWDSSALMRLAEAYLSSQSYRHKEGMQPGETLLPAHDKPEAVAAAEAAADVEDQSEVSGRPDQALADGLGIKAAEWPVVMSLLDGVFSAGAVVMDAVTAPKPAPVNAATVTAASAADAWAAEPEGAATVREPLTESAADGVIGSFGPELGRQGDFLAFVSNLAFWHRFFGAEAASSPNKPTGVADPPAGPSATNEAGGAGSPQSTIAEAAGDVLSLAGVVKAAAARIGAPEGPAEPDPIPLPEEIAQVPDPRTHGSQPGTVLHLNTA